MQKYIETISSNITELRKRNKLTQAEFGTRFNYSDKSVSKWERGDALPDLIVLKKISDAYNVPIEYFFYKHEEDEPVEKDKSAFVKRNYIAISLLVVCFVYLVATVVFVYTRIYEGMNLWICFVWAVPVSLLLQLLVTRKYLKRNLDIYFSSAFLWTFLITLYLQFLKFNIWIIFFIGVPLQAAFVLIEMLRRNKENEI